MSAKRLFAVLILAIPLIIFSWIVGTTGFAGATISAQAPRYLEVKASELAKLEQEQLARALADATEKANRMNDLWKNAIATYDRLLYVLLSIVTALCILLSFFLWRKPPNHTVERDARDSGARPSL